MAINSAIEWTESTWNPVTGCTKMSEGCRYCYAERMARRLQAMGQVNYRNGFTVTLHEKTLELPLHWKKPQSIFVNSMSDLFHEDVSDKFIQRVFDIMGEASWHRFQVLTKRTSRLCELSPKLTWHPNIWMGATVESKQYVTRIDDLKKIGAKIKFLSFEPLISPLDNLNLEGIDWVIVGGESGPGARPVEAEWVIDIKNQCQEYQTPFFFKQWGGINKKKAGRLLEGKTWNTFPVIA